MILCFRNNCPKHNHTNHFLQCYQDRSLPFYLRRVSYNLLQRPQTDWLAALELTEQMKSLNRKDPAVYDFALFALGVLEKF
ncbi:MAG: DUF2400 family protein [Sphingobacteriales bacterium]|nr:MAG: DUF2400 family protein [Sphingobacteriales bacterium]